MSRLTDDELLAFHRELVSTPSVSGDTAELAERLVRFFAARGHVARRTDRALLFVAGEGPVLILDTHFDTVPPAPGWTRAPFAATVESGAVYGLGANDAKASVAAMTAAFLALSSGAEPLGLSLALALAADEETASRGTSEALELLAADGRLERTAIGAIFGEPTGLDLAVAQKGLAILELLAAGTAAHAAHARSLGAKNAASLLARDLVALERVDLGPDHPALGATTLEPTLLSAGTARNVVPATARATLDLRTTPASPLAPLLARLCDAVAGTFEVWSDRFAPRETPAGSALLAAARETLPEARTYGSATLSDWALLPEEIPGIKVGPGRSERSHTPDEFVLESEIVEAARFYERCARALAAAAYAPAEASA